MKHFRARTISQQQRDCDVVGVQSKVVSYVQGTLIISLYCYFNGMYLEVCPLVFRRDPS